MFAYLVQSFCSARSHQIPVATKQDTGDPQAVYTHDAMNSECGVTQFHGGVLGITQEGTLITGCTFTAQLHQWHDYKPTSRSPVASFRSRGLHACPLLGKGLAE